MPEQTVRIAPEAHAMMISHAVQNVTTQVHGVLLGSFQGGEEEGGDVNATPTLTITKAVPICHEAPTKPLVDMALLLVEKASPSEQQIVGWYTSNEVMVQNSREERPHAPALRMASIIGSQLECPRHGGGVLILVRNSGALAKLLVGPDDDDEDDKDLIHNAIQVLGKDSRKQWLQEFQTVESTSESWEKSNALAQSAALKVQSGDIVIQDYVNMLEAPSVQWLENAALSKVIASKN
uniref:MPN domain-containing protein n=1 Tax=Attheya septentrionalis TaxID=420275 RepID=A0A7S2ULT8_9STRA|mmetsp:Transcript_3927/g.7066  ORF Transcript_3927/g.7066 Transcript_3927/m.7066 type:complete len:237 (+) Transcript_3927:70-780(+)